MRAGLLLTTRGDTPSTLTTHVQDSGYLSYNKLVPETCTSLFHQKFDASSCKFLTSSREQRLKYRWSAVRLFLNINTAVCMDSADRMLTYEYTYCSYATVRQNSNEINHSGYNHTLRFCRTTTREEKNLHDFINLSIDQIQCSCLLCDDTALL